MRRGTASAGTTASPRARAAPHIAGGPWWYRTSWLHSSRSPYRPIFGPRCTGESPPVPAPGRFWGQSGCSRCHPGTCAKTTSRRHRRRRRSQEQPAAVPPGSREWRTASRRTGRDRAVFPIEAEPPGVSAAMPGDVFAELMATSGELEQPRFAERNPAIGDDDASGPKTHARDGTILRPRRCFRRVDMKIRESKIAGEIRREDARERNEVLIHVIGATRPA
jgi:hypothetical protein